MKRRGIGFQGSLQAGAGVRTSVRAPRREGGHQALHRFAASAKPWIRPKLSVRSFAALLVSPPGSYLDLIGQDVCQPLVFAELGVSVYCMWIRCLGLLACGSGALAPPLLSPAHFTKTPIFYRFSC